MNSGLSEETIHKIRDVFSHYPWIEKAILYGSRAKGTYRDGSDIDIALVGDGMDITLLNAIRGEIDDLLLPYTFDISSLSSIDNHDLVEHIKRVGVVLYQR
jgi:predicted nucleotidyltransferase